MVEAAEASPQPQTGGTEYELIVSGEITSCSGWRLNRMPVLKAFLKDEQEWEWYRRLHVTYIPGQSKVLLQVNHNQEPVATIDLSEDPNITREQVHAILQEQGFERKSEPEISMLQQHAVKRRELDELHKAQKIQRQLEQQQKLIQKAKEQRAEKDALHEKLSDTDLKRTLLEESAEL